MERQTALQARLGEQIAGHAAHAIARSRLDFQKARLHGVAHSHAIIQSEVFRQVIAHLEEAYRPERPVDNFELIVDQGPKSGPAYLCLPQLDALQSATFDCEYLRKIASINDPEIRPDRPSLVTILQIEARTCQERLKSKSGEPKELKARLEKATLLLKNLGLKTHFHPVYSSKPFVQKLAQEVYEHRVKPVQLTSSLSELVNSLSSLATKKTGEIKLAAHQLENKSLHHKEKKA